MFQHSWKGAGVCYVWLFCNDHILIFQQHIHSLNLKWLCISQTWIWNGFILSQTWIWNGFILSQTYMFVIRSRYVFCFDVLVIPFIISFCTILFFTSACEVKEEIGITSIFCSCGKYIILSFYWKCKKCFSWDYCDKKVGEGSRERQRP